jgi:hypothetical protein
MRHATGQNQNQLDEPEGSAVGLMVGCEVVGDVVGAGEPQVNAP